MSLDGPNHSIKIPTLPSESTQGFGNFPNSNGHQIILRGTNNQQFMLVPIRPNQRVPTMYSSQNDYADQGIDIGTMPSQQSGQSKQGAQ